MNFFVFLILAFSLITVASAENVNIYKVNENNEIVFDCTAEIDSATIGDDKYYNINDIFNILDIDYQFIRDTSRNFFRTPYDNNTPPTLCYQFIYNDRKIEWADGKLYEYEDDEAYIMPSWYYFVETKIVNDEVYGDYGFIKTLFNVFNKNSNRLSFLKYNPDEISYLHETLTPAEKDDLVQAIWLLYNDYYAGYRFFMENVTNLMSLGSKDINSRLRKNYGVAAYVQYDKNSPIYINKDEFRVDLPQLAGILIHECTHINELKEKNGTNEIQPIINEIKTLNNLGWRSEMINGRLDYLDGINTYKEASRDARAVFSELATKE